MTIDAAANHDSLIGTTKFERAYDDLLCGLLESPFREVNQRTGAEIKMLPGGCSFKLDLTDQRLPVTGSRKLFPHVAAAEVAWFIKGEQDVTWLRNYAKIWDKFTEDDGKTIEAGYGYRWRRHFGRDQLGLAVDALRTNPTDRRVWVQAWDPAGDGLGAKGQKNVPCPVGFTFSLIDNALHSSLFIRSSDVFVGLPYDTMGHAMLMAVVGASVGATCMGTMHVTLAHPHLYEHHYGMAEHCVREGPTVVEQPGLYAWDLKRVEADIDGFVWAYRKAAQAVAWPDYNPRPEVVQ